MLFSDVIDERFYSYNIGMIIYGDGLSSCLQLLRIASTVSSIVVAVTRSGYCATPCARAVQDIHMHQPEQAPEQPPCPNLSGSPCYQGAILPVIVHLVYGSYLDEPVISRMASSISPARTDDGSVFPLRPSTLCLPFPRHDRACETPCAGSGKGSGHLRAILPCA